jgi:hypothetical protein
MPRGTRKKRIGIGATCTVLKRMLHPAKQIDEKYPNKQFHDRLDDLLVIGRDERRVHGKNQNVILFRHIDFDDNDVVLYCSPRFAKVTTEGPQEEIFDKADDRNEEGTGHNNGDDDNPVEVPAVDRYGNHAEDVARLLAEGYDVDDDNEPAPENIPNQDDPNIANYANYDSWGSRMYCKWTSEGHKFENPKVSRQPMDNKRMEWFLLFLPDNWMRTVLLAELNKNIMGGKEVEWPEFLRFIGLLLLMATVQVGCDRRSWFEDTEPSEFEGAPFRLQKYMSRSRFESILSALRYTSEPPPAYKDKFHQVRQMLKAWNDNMFDVFTPSWVSCLDESMSPWTSRWTCPGWMYVPRKPHPMGNEYHTICCGVSGIMFNLELVEGKDKPPQHTLAYDDIGGKTVGLLLRLTRPIWNSGKVVILDSGFCVLKAIIELKKKGVFASALIKKRRFWPKGINGDEITSHFDDLPVGRTDRLPGTCENIPFDVFAMKEPDYVMMLMSTYGALAEHPDQEFSYRGSAAGGDATCFKYKEVISNHYRYRGAVDEHNSKRHDGGTGCGISLEASWATIRWENRVFSFMLGISEVNAFLARSRFGGEIETQIQFRQKLAFDLITHMDDVRNNAEGISPERLRARNSRQHQLITAPRGSKFVGGKWQKCLKDNYQTYRCKHPGCKKRVRTVCSCSPQMWRCKECHITHVVEEYISH